MHPIPVPKTKLSAAFTLVELLIVLTMLALIAGTLGAASARTSLDRKSTRLNSSHQI